ncbi:hypothetical protein FOA52_009786 [Chlamydomonas sp. UWO 241]|nr:hypothetical protein FOA52_009786 [Chlamydomonas sp. UWO 241]
MTSTARIPADPTHAAQRTTRRRAGGAETLAQAAMLDLLTSQCDRHSGNVFIDEAGRVTLIDNEIALGGRFRCGTDSILLPGTSKNERIRFGRLLSKRQGARPPTELDIGLLLDYRCYVDGGAIGTKFTPQLTQGFEGTRRACHTDYVTAALLLSGTPALAASPAVVEAGRASVAIALRRAIRGAPKAPPKAVGTSEAPPDPRK